MSLRQRRATYTATAALWVLALILAAAASQNETPLLGPLADLARSLATVASLASVIAWLMSPLAASARLWLHIGRQLEKRDQESTAKAQALLRRITHSDN